MSAADVGTAAVAAVGVSGAWLSVAGGADGAHLMRVSDVVSERLAGLELTLGEGPSLDAAASGGPVLASDLAAVETAGRWPVFAPAALRAGAAAVFVFPLRVGAIRAGVMGLYRDRAGPLSAAQLGDALVFADTATLLLLDAQDQATGGPGAAAGPAGSPRAWPGTGPRSTRPPGCSPSSSAPASPTRSPGCAPMPTLRTVRWTTWPAISWPAACACAVILTRPTTVRREACPARRLPGSPDPDPDGSSCI